MDMGEWLISKKEVDKATIEAKKSFLADAHANMMSKKDG